MKDQFGAPDPGDRAAAASTGGHAPSDTTKTDVPAGQPAQRETGAPPGAFQRIRLHARGGLGQVSVARDGSLNREVALKEIRPEFAGDELSRRRFLSEAEITGQLEHPGIVPVYSLQLDDDGNPSYAMRFIQGRTLAEAIKEYHRGPDVLTLRHLLGRFITVCRTIAYAHSRGVIHRDLKPANVMLGDYGETLVVDWGLAKRVDDPSPAVDQAK